MVELDALFWQPGPTAMDPAEWTACHRQLVQRNAWIIDGDLGSYDSDLQARLRAADTVIVLDFSFLLCAWRTLCRSRERGDYWRWIWFYRRRSLPALMQAITAGAPHAKVHVLRTPAMVQRFVAELRKPTA